MKKLLFIAAAVLLPFMASAQFSISGKISDKNSGSALIGASVGLENTYSSSRTDASGNYTLKNLKPGNYLVKVSFLGYQTLERSISLNGNISLNLELIQNSLLADEVLVRATRASENSASTYSNISKEQLEKNNLGQDLPFLLNQTPSVVVSSDAGNGVGYTGIRIRGSDPTRLNVTINGIPYNDPESQGTYWVNLPDFASSVDNIQIQRGVGTSTNGAGAFGGSLNIQTTTKRDSAYAELNNTFGSYQTIKNTINAGTGLINNKFSFDGRLSRIQSDGYIDRGSSMLKSYFLSAAYYGKKDLLRANVFSGSEKTYQAWNGVPQNLLKTNRTFNSFTYDDQTDNYVQDHYQLLYSHTFSSVFSANTALHYTKGRGYYEEFKEDQNLANYGIAPFPAGGITNNRSDLVRRRWLDNNFYGLTYSLDYRPSGNISYTLGGAYNEYDGDHFGEVIRGQFIPIGNSITPYYKGNGFKTDFNTFAKAEFKLGNLNLFADLQYRSVNYKVSGTDKNRMNLHQNDQLNFFNPKLGFSYEVNKRNNVYASIAIANKEPNRDDYINSSLSNRPSAENLLDIETGYRHRAENFTAGINAYAMYYKDQLVLTGKVNDVGEYIRQNVEKSYRYGLEMDTKVQINNSLFWSLTASLSDNKIKNFTEYSDDYDNGGQIITNYKNTDLAFSPTFISSSEISFLPFKKTEIALLSKYVSEQYLDNTSNSQRKLDAFFVNDLRLRYNTSFKGLKNIGLTLLVNNVFSELYEANGYTFSYMYGGDFTTENFYYPQATRNFLLSLSLKF
ncbi:iron complex outermembrane recepter protein [Daejeonella rubra]|uniref:Iron complex outermembrane recepter protein n=1 Tax=Daejeonella rubra TaxID=990371 RepID=A0A1G9QZH2_9SPHI|nr:TonB-dependent receptor [Daejeonella rubra]SDM16426.1 iron complex outermembrane recepter protein [Daejeonella rubra]